MSPRNFAVICFLPLTLPILVLAVQAPEQVVLRDLWFRSK